MARYPWFPEGFKWGEMRTCAECGKEFTAQGGHRCGADTLPEDGNMTPAEWRGMRERFLDDPDGDPTSLYSSYARYEPLDK